MKKFLLLSLLLAAWQLPIAYGQVCWATMPGAPSYPNYSGGPSFSALSVSDYLCAPQPNVLWGLLPNSYSQGSPGQRDNSETLFCTTDNGQTWNSVVTNSTYGRTSGGISTRALSAVDGQKAWILSTGGIFRTTTGINGFVNMGSNLAASFQDIHFFTELIGVGFAYSGVANTLTTYRTTDGGYTWAQVYSMAAPGFGRVIKHSMGNSFWLSNGYGGGYILRTTNAGLTWAVIASVGNVAFESELQGLGHQYISQSAMQVARTIDGGLTWTIVPGSSSPFTFVRDMISIPGMAGTYLAIGSTSSGSNVTAISYNWGTSWQVLSTGLPISSDNLRQVAAGGPGQLWASVQGDVNMIMRYSCTALATQRSSAAPQLLAYPNPTTNLLTLAGPLQGTETARLYDGTGRLCLSTTFSDAHRQCDLSAQAPGLYSLLLTDEAGNLRTLRVSKLP